MKIHRLSSFSERICAVIISTISLFCMAFLLLLLRSDLLSFIICMIASVLVSLGLGFYVLNLFKSACIPHQEDTLLEIKGYPDTFILLGDVTCLETVSVKSGPVTTRSLIFTDRNGQVIASVPTFFTANQGAQAEPLAMELAAELGISFKATLEPWEYDKEKRKEHQKEVAMAEKKARKEKLQALKAKILRKPEAGKPAPDLSEEVSVSDRYFEGSSDGINYDAMDDEK